MRFGEPNEFRVVHLRTLGFGPTNRTNWSSSKGLASPVTGAPSSTSIPDHTAAPSRSGPLLRNRRHSAGTSGRRDGGLAVRIGVGPHWCVLVAILRMDVVAFLHVDGSYRSARGRRYQRLGDRLRRSDPQATSRATAQFQIRNPAPRRSSNVKGRNERQGE